MPSGDERFALGVTGGMTPGGIESGGVGSCSGGEERLCSGVVIGGEASSIVSLG
jgi:hypothetical protein